jgi:hypothetical protein
MLSYPTRIETAATSSTRLTQRMDVLPSRAPLPRPRTIHDRTLVVRRAHGRASAWSRPTTIAGGLLLAWGLVGTLAHVWLSPIAPLA